MGTLKGKNEIKMFRQVAEKIKENSSKTKEW